jgi:hypothetical protein
MAYTGHLTHKNTGRWHAIIPGQWATVRHQIESFGLEILEKEALSNKLKTSYNGRPHGNTIIRAYEAFVPQRNYKNNINEWPIKLKEMLNIQSCESFQLGPEIQGRSYLLPNTFVFLIRESMPLGGKPFVPIQETSKYALANHNLSLRPQNEDLQKHLNELVKSTEDKFHAADRPIKKVCVTFFKSSTEYEYLEPPIDYMCTECQKFGHHYKEACWLWPKSVATKQGFGAKKFGQAKNTEEYDTLYYSLLHKRVNRPSKP